MQKRYKLLMVFSIAAIFWTLYAFDYGESQLITKSKHSTVKKNRKPIALENPAENDEMVTAILIMPKSYLPALKRFSQSAMARNVKILRAQLEVKDGIMTAVRQDNRVTQRGTEIESADISANQTIGIAAKLPPDQEKQVLSAGFLYMLTSIEKSRFIR